MSSNYEEDLLEADEAAQYLARKWGRPFNRAAFKTYRLRKGIKPTKQTKNNSLWSIRDLDKIEEPDRSRPRGPRHDREASEGPGARRSISTSTSKSMVSASPHMHYTQLEKITQATLENGEGESEGGLTGPSVTLGLHRNYVLFQSPTGAHHKPTQAILAGVK